MTAPRNAQTRSNVAIVSNELTPYRLHVLERLRDELPEVKFHNLFTHACERPTWGLPWKVAISEGLNPVFFPEAHLEYRRLQPARCWKLYVLIREYLEANEVRLVLLHGYHDSLRLLLLRWGRRNNVPVVMTGDCNIRSEARHGAVRRVAKRAVLRWVIGSAAALMPMGRHGRAFYRHYADHEKPEFLFPYEPDYSRFTSPDLEAVERFSASHGLHPARRRFLFCGRLVAPKRVDIALQAFVAIQSAMPSWDLVIVGDGPLGPSLRSRFPASERIKWVGYLDPVEVATCFHACDVLVLPSDMEPWAVVVNEAVAAGLPVVTTDNVGAAAELVEDGVNGFIVPAGDPTAFAQALSEFTDDARYESLKAACPRVLARWRKDADPVDGVRAALRHFGVHVPERSEGA